jgi:hypothetical protein
VLPVLEAYGLDLYFAGDNHAYERSYLLDGHYGLAATLTSSMILDPGSGRAEDTGVYDKHTRGPTPHQGAVYVVAGCAAHLDSGTNTHPANYITRVLLGSVIVDVNDGRLDVQYLTSTGVIEDHFTILKANHPPVADASATPLRSLISSNNLDARVVLDGSRSFDPEHDPLQFQWRDSGVTISAGMIAIATLPVGPHLILLQVSDGQAFGTNVLSIEVVTAGQSAERLAGLIENSSLSRKNARPLLAKLDEAGKEFARGHMEQGVHHLEEFQKKVRTQDEKIDAALAAELIRLAQDIINAVGDTRKKPKLRGHPHSQPPPPPSHLPVTGLTLQIEGTAGQVYVVEVSTDMIHWQPIGTAQDRGEGSFEFEDTNSNSACRFYRVVSP